MNENKSGNAPDFIGIGAMKAATYWFYCCLRDHPEVRMSDKKEVHFFDVKENYRKGTDWYESFFADCEPGRLKGEVTPGYLCTEGAADRIAECYPEVKLFACLRNPVERAYSHYRFNVMRQGNMAMHADFDTAVEKEPSLIDFGMYASQLERYYKRFGRDKLHVIRYDDIDEDPAGVLQGLFRFLGIDESFIPEVTNQKKGVTGTRAMEYKIPFIMPVFFRLSAWLRGGMIDKILSDMGMKYAIRNIVLSNRRVVEVKDTGKVRFPELSAETYNRYIARFREDLARVEEMTGCDLSRWKQAR